MARIELETVIKAPAELVFDLARSIDLHTKTASLTNEEAVDGVTKGLIGYGETVTWQATHFGFRLSHTSKITIYDRPFHFRDSMTEGVFARLDHDHFFCESDDGVVMKDVFDYDPPFWIFGKAADALFLKRNLASFLETRNKTIKEIAENDRWAEFV